jgi:hypothetical protein
MPTRGALQSATAAATAQQAATSIVVYSRGGCDVLCDKLEQGQRMFVCIHWTVTRLSTTVSHTKDMIRADQDQQQRAGLNSLRDVTLH